MIKPSLLICTLLAAAQAIGAEPNPSTPAAKAVPLSWLGAKPPLTPVGVSWGVPWPRGTMAKESQVVVRTADGQSLPTQTWPLAYWPDGSVKWSGLAIAADSTLATPLTVGTGSAVVPKSPVTVQEDANCFLVV